MDINRLKAIACSAIDKKASDLETLSDEIWKNPELAYEERTAHRLLTDFLQREGFVVEKQYKLETAFRATFGRKQKDGVNIGIFCEYDALPDIGHACGHNLIAEAGCAAGLAVKAALSASPHLDHVQVTVIGTPAEEQGGGKVKLLNAGAFDDLDLAMMAHPSPYDFPAPPCIARDYLTVSYKKEPSCDDGTANPLDAVIAAYSGMSLFRQQMKQTWRIHGIISDGGNVPGSHCLSSSLMPPEVVSMEYYLRAPTDGELGVLRKKAETVFRASGVSHGCTVEIEEHPRYSSLLSNPELVQLYVSNCETAGLTFRGPGTAAVGHGSTDMGNVSYSVPSLHPKFSVMTDAAIHTRAFTDVAKTATAHERARCTARALALTALDVACDFSLFKTIRNSFEVQRKQAQSSS
eukprot:m.41662 g.41662  ORF g.41662 m.41662 type:complete len:407 (+) comp33213_c0_seq1:110-1330(+)